LRRRIAPRTIASSRALSICRMKICLTRPIRRKVPGAYRKYFRAESPSWVMYRASSGSSADGSIVAAGMPCFSQSASTWASSAPTR
jgi:hypothetical protein